MNDSPTRVSQKVAIVTGGARGIGLAISKCLAGKGIGVVIADLDEGSLPKAIVELDEFRTKNLGIRTNISRWGDVERLVGRVLDEFGRIDILVNNAGITGKIRPITEITEEEWDAVIDVDLKGGFLCSKAVIPHMIRQGAGNIVNIASIAGKEGNAKMTAYSAAKGGVIALTKALAQEVVTMGIRVNCVAPALVQTELLSEWPEDQIRELRAKIPMGRFGKTEEIANVVWFLISDESSFITGQCINVDGGRGRY